MQHVGPMNDRCLYILPAKDLCTHWCLCSFRPFKFLPAKQMLVSEWQGCINFSCLHIAHDHFSRSFGLTRRYAKKLNCSILPMCPIVGPCDLVPFVYHTHRCCNLQFVNHGASAVRLETVQIGGTTDVQCELHVRQFLVADADPERCKVARSPQGLPNPHEMPVIGS